MTYNVYVFGAVNALFILGALYFVYAARPFGVFLTQLALWLALFATIIVGNDFLIDPGFDKLAAIDRILEFIIVYIICIPLYWLRRLWLKLAGRSSTKEVSEE